MRKTCLALLTLLLLSGCASDAFSPDYNYITQRVTIADKSSRHVVYEYSDIRVDEIVPVASIYCYENGGYQAELRDITLWHNNRRRATFICQ